MAHHLSQRDPWQSGAAAAGSKLRDRVAEILSTHLEESYSDVYKVTIEPPDLKQLYYEHDATQNPTLYERPAAPTSDDVWFDAQKGCFLTLKAGKEAVAAGGGCTPDIKIECVATGSRYFLECKQQGDVGNAHERCAKFATPSVIGLIQNKISASYHPIAYLFSGPLVKKRKYILELAASYAFAKDHLVLWDADAAEARVRLIEWAERVVIPLLSK